MLIRRIICSVIIWRCPLYQLEAEGFLASGDKAAMYALIAEKFGIEKSSIFAV